MRAVLCLCALTLAAGCHRQVAVPTANELIGNRQLLAEWQAKCDTGEYSHLAASEKANLCSTTHDATISVAEIEAGKSGANFFDANTKRK